MMKKDDYLIGRAGIDANSQGNPHPLLSGATPNPTHCSTKSTSRPKSMKIFCSPSLGHLSTAIRARRVALSLLFLGPTLALVQPCAGGTGFFENTGSLAAVRGYHTSTLLPNGKVLVAGGAVSGSAGSLATAELYDPATGSWMVTGNLTIARTRHRATLLQNGKVLVAGGYDNPAGLFPTTTELYDPATGTWTATGNLAAARYDHTATLLQNGKVLVAGGFDTNGFALASAEIYDPASGTWTATGNLTVARQGHTATLLQNGKVLVAGAGQGSSISSAELYDPASGIWTATGSMATARGGTATLLSTGDVLVVGGNQIAGAEIYHPASGTWTATGSPATPRNGHTATLLSTGKVLVAGNSFFGNQANEELYDPVSGTWSATASLVTQRAYHTTTLLSDGRALVAGGTSFLSGQLASAELYVSGQPTPTPIPMGTPTALGNISTRLRVETGDNALIGGFIITGTQPKKIIVRAIGPSLTTFPDRLADPTLELRDSTGALVASNDNWRSTQEAEIIASTVPPTNDLESAIVATLAANSAGYTAIVRGANNGTGIGVVEVYDLDAAGDSRLANISTRGSVQTGNNVLIAGTIVLGQAAQRVIVRALGPSLTIAGNLADPTLELRDGNGAVLMANDNWRSTQEAEIIATTVAPTNDLESAIVATLPANNAAYTAIVRGANDTTGIAVVEVYALN